MGNDRVIDLVQITNFMVEVERVRDRSLVSCPIVIAPMFTDTAKVWGCSDEASATGIDEGLELAMAKRICPDIKVIAPNPDLYQSIHRKICQKLHGYTPLFEAEKLGRVFLDFTGFDQLYGNPVDFAQKLLKEVYQDFSLRPFIGVSSNKLLSHAACELKGVDDFLRYVGKERESSFLDPFSVDIVPYLKLIKDGVNPFLKEFYEDLNLHLIRDLKSLDRLTLRALFYKDADYVYDIVRGIDHSPVCPPLREETLWREKHITPTNQYQLIFDLFYSLLVEAFTELRRKNKTCGEVVWVLRYGDYKYSRKKIKLGRQVAYPYEVTYEFKKAFDFIFTRRVDVRYLYVELKLLTRHEMQLCLFEDKRKNIIDTLDAINQRFPTKVSLGKRL